MKFTVIQESTNVQFILPRSGIYHFKVISAKEVISRRGYEMLEISLELDVPYSDSISDYLSIAQPERRKSFIESIDAEYLLNRPILIPGDVLYTEGIAEIVIDTDCYGKQARVGRYLKSI